ncbi:STAS domain-containing protein [Methylogaea oryzae]|uniref:Anti-sigma factor antagonist n=1 Tax=Methylogaea oryzae TaxID=1295382 RepID=A0A8D4VN59_9GAMM|nr:STAS domain-containing protein [Methylogaea oryzae]BBL71273.1 STAS domain-containing protein [Methylogaea oryzae]
MQIRTDIYEKKATLTLNGRFDFTLHKDFRDTYEQALSNSEVKAIEINLRDVDYLDSSALGMLLLLKDRAAQAGASVSLNNCRETVRQILEIANFHKLFTIS